MLLSTRPLLVLATLAVFSAPVQALAVGVYCPLTAKLTIIDEAFAKNVFELERTSATYSGDGSWGPRWWCDYALKEIGRKGNKSTGGFIRAQLVSGEPTLGTRFQFLRESTSRYLLTSLNRTRLAPGAGLDAFNNYNHDPVKVTRAQFTWDRAPRAAEDAMARDEYAFATFGTDAVAGECRADLARALKPDTVRFVTWSASQNRLWFDLLPGTVQTDSRTGDHFKAGNVTRCTEVRRPIDARLAVRCEMTYDLAAARWLTWAEAEARKSCVYAAGSALPPAYVETEQANPAPTLSISGAAADFAAAVGRGPCQRKAGTGTDSRCDFVLDLQ